MSITENNVVVGFGEVLWDLLPEGKQIGGAPANFAYHAAQWGLAGWAVSAIGDDALGQEALESFNGKNLNLMIDKVEYPTGTVIVELEEGGIPAYTIKEGVAWDNIPLGPAMIELASSAKAVCFGSLAQRSVVSRNTLHGFLDAMPSENTLKVFDINLRQNFYTNEIIHDSLERCNVLKINDEELVQLGRMFGYPGIDLQDKCWLLLGKFSLKMLILTCGVNGSYVFTPGHISFMPTPQVEVVDTVGAGDSFSGTFMASILNGCSIEDAHYNAITVSAFVCTQRGAMPPIPVEIRQKMRGLPPDAQFPAS